MQFSDASGVVAQSVGELLSASPLSRQETRALLAHQLGVTRERLIAQPELSVAPADVQAFAQLVQRCQRGEPLAYVLGEKEFYGRVLEVSPAVLTPRPETELLIEVALTAGLSDDAHVLDLGTGSGCVALTLALERPSWKVTATDVSHDALEVARSNAAKLSVDTVAFRKGSWFSALSDRRFNLIVSNPPYVAAGDSHLQALRFEPQMALVAGGDGLACLQQIVESAPRHLLLGGILALEHGYEQGEAVRALFNTGAWCEARTLADFAGLDRVTLARLV
ncbi:MAG: peptide chain release factor N(5)-glutamine methyltransferase [Burkholderiaceae bacterium]